MAGERFDRIASDIFNCITTTEEVLQDQLRAKFEEAIDSVLCAVVEKQGVPSPSRSVVGPHVSSRIHILASEALRPSEAAVRECFHVLQNEWMEALQEMKKSDGVADLSSSRFHTLDIDRLGQLEDQIDQLQHTLNVAVAELERGAKQSKKLEARCISFQTKAASAEQRASQAEAERQSLAKQLAQANQLLSQMQQSTGRSSNNLDRLGSAELRAANAEKAAEEATVRADSLSREINVLRLQTQLAIEQLRAMGMDFHPGKGQLEGSAGR
mmetsp:Transcript_19208/g.53550  ORF Transcript_19208/g.53550 Transcript_19208/m.53550 type:complete len:270 (-) Transcript_19208:139-948(-)